MIDKPGPVLSRPQSDMLAHVEALLARHPRLLPLLESGWSLEISCDDSAIRVDAAGPAPGTTASTELRTPRWWLPARSGRALAIAEELAVALAAEIDPDPSV